MSLTVSTPPARLRIMAMQRSAQLLVAATALLCLVLTAFVIADLVSGWVPQGDEGIIAVKVHDVFSSHPPLQGQRSTSDLTTPGVFAHHPGPAQFYLLALPYALTGYLPAGLLIGCLLVQVACIVVAVRAALRTGGPAAGWLVVTVFALLVAGFRSYLVEPWNFYFPVLGLVTVIVLAWRLAVGHSDVLVAFVAFASLVAQPHIALLPVILCVSIVVTAIGLWQWRIRHDAMWPLSGAHPHDRPVWWRRRGTIAVAVGALCWAPVVVEALSFRPNNLLEMWHVVIGARSGTSSTAPQPVQGSVGISAVGISAAARSLGAMVMPWGGPVAHLAVMTGLAVVAALAAWDCLRRARVDLTLHRAVVSTAVVIAAGGSVAALLVGARAQSGIQLTYLAISTGVIYLSAGMSLWWLCLRVPRRWLARRWRVGAIGVLAAAVVAAAFTYPAPSTVHGGSNYRRQVAVAADADRLVVRELDRPEYAGRAVVIRYRGGYSWASLSSAVAAAVAARGRDVYFDVAWPRPQDDDFRRTSKAPADAVTVWLRDIGPGQNWPPGSAPDDCEQHDIDLSGTSSPGSQAQVCVTG